MFLDILNPIVGINFTQEHHVSKLIKRHVTTLENRAHQVLLAAEQAITGAVLMLPDGAKPLLYSQRIRQFSHLLEFVDAYNYVLVTLDGNLFGQAQHLFRRMCSWCDAER